MKKTTTVALLLTILVIGCILYFSRTHIQKLVFMKNCEPDAELTSIQSGKVEDEWKEYKTVSGFSFKYPSDTFKLNDLNIKNDGTGSYDIVLLPSVGSYDRVISIQINKELAVSEGWTYDGIYNNQNPLLSQLKRLQKESKVFNYYPCLLDANNKTVIRTNNSIVILWKKGDTYLMARSFGDLNDSLAPEQRVDINKILTSIR